MAFTTPRTWVADEDVTPDIMNVHVRDQLRAMSQWESWEPTWTATGGTPNIGNGTMAGYYCRYGQVCHVKFVLVFGSTTTIGTSTAWKWTLPVPMSGSATPLAAAVVDTGTGVHPGCTWLADASNFRVIVAAVAPGSIGYGVPMNWAEGDMIAVNGTYRV